MATRLNKHYYYYYYIIIWFVKGIAQSVKRNYTDILC